MNDTAKLNKLLIDYDPCTYLLSSYFNDDDYYYEYYDSSCIDPPKNLALERKICNYYKYKDSCRLNLIKQNSSDANVTSCPAEFDGFMCWPSGQPGTLVQSPCPTFDNRVSGETHFGYRYCDSNGSWWQNINASGESNAWNNIDECNEIYTFISSDNQKEEELYIYTTSMEIQFIFSTISIIGSSISIFLLITALLIMFAFKLHRLVHNRIHCNLMISYLVHNIVFLIEHEIMVDFIMIESCDDFDRKIRIKSIICCLSNFLSQYTLLTNYFWLLAEGIHLQILLLFPLRQSRKFNMYFFLYLIFGWGVPLMPIGCWVALSLTYDSTETCWSYHNEKYDYPYWTIDIPAAIVIFINFLLFINILRIIISKIKARAMDKSDIRWVLAKSTLILFCLLGPYYIVTVVILDMVDLSSTSTYTTIVFVKFFHSFQGSFIPLFYCFFNSKMWTCIKRQCKDCKMKKIIFRACFKSHLKTTVCELDPVNNHDKKKSFEESGSTKEPFFVTDSDFQTNRDDFI